MAVTTLTFKEIIDLTSDQLQEIMGATDMTMRKIRRYINLGYNDFTRRTKILTDNYDITTVADQESYSLVTGAFLQISHVRYIEDSDNEYGEPLKMWPGGYAGLPKNKEFGTPERYWHRYHGDNTTVEIGTVPIASTADKTISVFGYKLPSPMTLDSAVPVIHEAYHEALILYPVWKLCNAYAHKSKAIREKALTARNEYLEMVADAKGDNTAFSMDDIETVDEYDSWNFD